MTEIFGTLVAAAAPPAGGAELGQIVIATVAATIVTCALLYLGLGHRSGRVKILQRLADHAERTSGFPGWVAFPSAVATVSLLAALFGMYWDISLHIDNGRDPGPLANPAHYFILAGLFGIFSAGFFAMVLPKEKPSARRRPHRPRLVGAARRRPDLRLRRLLADRLPARRRLAPPLRPGRDALGADPPDADRRRGDDAGRDRRALGRGDAGQRLRRCLAARAAHCGWPARSPSPAG